MEEPVFKSVEWCDPYWSKLLENCLRNALGSAPVKKLDIPSRPDVRKWLQALKLLFPNVVDVSAAAVGCYDFVMSLRGMEPRGDRHILLLWSDSVGGVGKDTFQRGLTEYLSKAYGATCTHSPASCGSYLSPDTFKANVTVFEEMNPAEWPVGIINNIIDREPAAFNQKYGASGQFVNSAALIGTSNDLPVRRNNRRWNVVEYITKDMRGRPMPSEDARTAAYRDFVEACPIGADKSMFGSPDKDRQFMVQDVIELVQDNRNEPPSTPSRLLRKTGRDHDTQLRSQMRNMFYQLQAEGRFPQRWNGNSFSATYFNWKKIAEFFDTQQQRFTVDSDDPLEACAAKWDDLIYRLCGPAPEGPSDGPTARQDEGPCATAAESSGRDTGRSGRVPARPAVYDRL